MEMLLFFAPLIARCLIGFYFVFFGIWNIYHYRPIILAMTEKNIPHPWLALPLGIAWQVILGSMIICNLQIHLAALGLIPFTIIAICIFHPFWKYKSYDRVLNFTIFMANLTVTLGSLLLLMTNITSTTSLIH